LLSSFLWSAHFNELTLEASDVRLDVDALPNTESQLAQLIFRILIIIFVNLTVSSGAKPTFVAITEHLAREREGKISENT
jgi:hypothetical protein